jgi:hypothetical protein
MPKKNSYALLFNTDTPPSLWELMLSLLAFAGTAIVAVLQDWQAADIIWAAWFSSLFIGMSFFLVMTFKLMGDKARGIELKEEKGSGPGCLGAATMGFMGLLAWLAGPGFLRIILICLIMLDLVFVIMNALAPKRRLGLNPELPAIKVLLFIPTALYFFFFFLGHFGGFHGGHAFVLGLLVPLQLEIPGTLDSMASARNLFFSFFRELFLAYWPYVLSVAMVSFEAYRKALMEPTGTDYMILPYKNVIRIHLLIFVLAPLAMLGIGKVVMLVVLFFFYFPVERTAAWLRMRKK